MADENKEETQKTGPAGELPPIDFVAFISSLAATVLLQLGEKLSPDQPEGAKNLPAAKQMIDLIELVKEKTKGNLDQHESEVIDGLLYNLRMRYIRELNR